MPITRREPASPVRAAATDFVITATRQNLDCDREPLEYELTYVITDMVTLARSIEALADNPVVIGTTATGRVNTGLGAEGVQTVLRLAQWIGDIGRKAIADFDDLTRPAARHASSEKEV